MAAHTDTCYTVRYGRLSTDAREFWPPAFGGREDLCTSGANPDARWSSSTTPRNGPSSRTRSDELPASLEDTDAPKDADGKKVFVIGPEALIRAHAADWADWRQPAKLVPHPTGDHLITLTDLHELDDDWELLDLGVNLDPYWGSGPARTVLRERVLDHFGIDIG